jgi:two-component system CheB/CheR fusion protein
VENQVETKDDRWYTMRIMPYRTVDNVIDGVVITFNDITELKRLEESNKAAREYAEAIIDTIREPLVVLDQNMNVVTADKAFYHTFHVTPAETEHHSLFEIGNGQWNIPELRRLLENVLPDKKTFENFKDEHDFPGIGRRVMMLNGRKIDSGENKGLILLAIHDVTA